MSHIPDEISLICAPRQHQKRVGTEEIWIDSDEDFSESKFAQTFQAI
jgi:hypothetical protein